MKIGIILQSNKPERVWNTFRFGSKACPVSTMADLLRMVEESDKVLVFG